jgi:DNA-binding SARP family transcriptional activator
LPATGVFLAGPAVDLPAVDPGSNLHLHPAGVPRLLGSAGPLRLATRKALALVVLLTLEGPMRRQRLAELLWPDLDRATARRNLRREVFRLREVGLTMADAGADTLGLQLLALAWPAAADASPLWLEGLDTAAGAEFDEWVLLQRERLQRLWLDRLDDQAAALQQRQGQFGRAMNDQSGHRRVAVGR